MINFFRTESRQKICGCQIYSCTTGVTLVPWKLLSFFIYIGISLILWNPLSYNFINLILLEKLMLWMHSTLQTLNCWTNIFSKKCYFSADEAFDGSYQSNVLVSDEGKNTNNMDLFMHRRSRKVSKCEKYAI